jgi:hypothetical protein
MFLRWMPYGFVAYNTVRDAVGRVLGVSDVLVGTVSDAHQTGTQMVPEESFWAAERAFQGMYRHAQQLQDELVTADQDVLELGKRVRSLEAELEQFRESSQLNVLSSDPNATVVIPLPSSPSYRVLTLQLG